MRILLINPNSTAEMTASIAAEARLAARDGTEIVAVNPSDGPPAIQGAADGEAALPGLFALFDKEMAAQSYDAVIIACFDDTGLWELRRRARVPVIGIGEAGYLAGSVMGMRFSVVTTLQVAVPVLEGNLARYGLARRCAHVRASGVPVLALETDRKASTDAIAATIAAALREDECDAIVLGCAGMAGLAEDMAARFGIPVIDGVAAAVGLCETVARGVPSRHHSAISAR
ncbi:aspartate/glutamate racemase family protein [Pelagibacterium xiamenense]|uniref:aspartate/glutamate racemase family protein n=1 Tax=Pelagibacterium xiamenense TaxID=2901140 RepID=UPI001E658F02|nr:aspartate/glutamate racemase family protein [Pelagibacterium xiamenense]MCD7059733.1 aspartate/glutamate racemase family protein [Pelagibacterium xiamenense]